MVRLGLLMRFACSIGAFFWSVHASGGGNVGEIYAIRCETLFDR